MATPKPVIGWIYADDWGAERRILIKRAPKKRRLYF